MKKPTTKRAEPPVIFDKEVSPDYKKTPIVQQLDENTTEGDVMKDDLNYVALCGAALVASAQSVRTIGGAARLLAMTDQFIGMRRRVFGFRYGVEGEGKNRRRVTDPID